MSPENTKNPATIRQTNKEVKENQKPSEPKNIKSPDKAGTAQVKASNVVTAQTVPPLDPSKAGTGAQKPPPAGKKTRGPDKQPRKKRADAKPELAPEQKPPEVVATDPAAAPPVQVDLDMVQAEHISRAFVVTFDVVFCKICPPKLSTLEHKTLIDVWTPVIFIYQGQMSPWLPAALVTLGIAGQRLVTKIF